MGTAVSSEPWPWVARHWRLLSGLLVAAAALLSWMGWVQGSPGHRLDALEAAVASYGQRLAETDRTVSGLNDRVQLLLDIQCGSVRRTSAQTSGDDLLASRCSRLAPSREQP